MSCRVWPYCLSVVSIFWSLTLAGSDDKLSIYSTRTNAVARWNMETGEGHFSNGFILTGSNVTLKAESGTINTNTGLVSVEGDVLLKQESQLWRGDQLDFNFRTRDVLAKQFRLGQPPFFAEGGEVITDPTNGSYIAKNAYLTTEDVQDPKFKVRAKELEVAPGKYVKAKNATVRLGGIPVFWLPYYRYDLDADIHRFEPQPGFRSGQGAYLLNRYNWYRGDRVTAGLNLDYRTKRGGAVGQEGVYDLGDYGAGGFSAYFLDDQEPENDATGNPVDSFRHRFKFSHQLSVEDKWSSKLFYHDLGDAQVNREFFIFDHQRNTQPKSFLEVERKWSNHRLSLFARPQIDGFFETVERLPELRLASYRQQIGQLPLYYEGDSSLGYLRRRFADGNPALDYAAFRGDTFHQVVSPHMVGGWLNVMPRAGIRLTHYGESEGPGGLTLDQQRVVYNTGIEVSSKFSRLWSGSRNRALDLDGLRHIVIPSINYVFTPAPNVVPGAIPQFDQTLPSLRLLPIDFPEFNSIDAIDSQNVLRFGVRNKLQTKRNGMLENVVNWAVFNDWRLNPNPGQSTLSDLYSDMDIRPRSWLTFNSQVRYNLNNTQLQQMNHSATILPNNRWSWSVGQRYIRNGAAGSGLGNNLVFNSFYYRVNENWGTRATHHFEGRDGTMEQQDYSIYRDFRSWVGSLLFRVRDRRQDGNDYSVVIRFSLKAFPRHGLNSDRDTPNYVLGGPYSLYN